jgi:hypothetical protein
MRMITYQQSSFGAIDCGCTVLVGGWGNGEACGVGLVRGEEEGNRTSRKSIVSHVTELRCLQFPETGHLKDSL